MDNENKPQALSYWYSDISKKNKKIQITVHNGISDGVQSRMDNQYTADTMKMTHGDHGDGAYGVGL